MSAIQLHTCGPGCPPGCGAKKAAADAIVRRDKRRLTVDFHCHAFVPAVEALVADEPCKKDEPAMMVRAMGAVSVDHNNNTMLPVAGPRLVDLELRLKDMDAMGVDVQVLSPSPSQYYYWAEADLAEQVVRIHNEAITELCSRYPDRLVGLGTVALRHPALAVPQLENCVRELGLRGVEISTAADSIELSDPGLERFWAKVEELGCIVFIHPFGTTLGERLNKYYLSNLIGQPLETSIALSHLIFGGVLDRHPGLKIVAAHGGGYLPHYVGRSDHGYRVRPEAGACLKKPSEYLKQIWFDSLIYSPEAVRRLVDVVGASQVVAGTDYPFDMGAYDLHALIDAVPGLNGEERAQILGGNAERLLKLRTRRRETA